MKNQPDILALLDPEIALALSRQELANKNLSHETLAGIRAARAALPPPALSDAVERTDYVLPERPQVSVRVHRVKTAVGPLPAIYWMHGGGLVMGTNLIDDARFDRWCPGLGCVGVSVDYTLAPESPYPGPLEDCFAGLAWVHRNSAELGIDPMRIGIGGSSAGGGLAAALALLCRDRGGPRVDFQALIYPMLDDRASTASSQWQDPVWPPAANRFGWDSYLGSLDRDEVPPYAAPARALDLAGLPPTFVSVGALDVFSDEDVDFANRLRHASVPVDLRVYAGAPHGFDSVTPGTAIARKANADLEAWLSEQLDRRNVQARSEST